MALKEASKTPSPSTHKGVVLSIQLRKKRKMDGTHQSERFIHAIQGKKEWSGFLWNHVLRMELIHCVYSMDTYYISTIH